jgi:archaemetzincin
VALLAACLVLTPTPGRATRATVVAIQPIGEGASGKQIEAIRAALFAFYGFQTTVLSSASLPKAAYYAKRRRYRADTLLDFLLTKIPAGAHRIIGVTNADISTTKGKIHDWGVLGLATLDGKACVISAYRAKRGARGVEHTRTRLAKVAVHEIGHTLGLPHCPSRGCLLEDARGKVTTTDRETDLCARCRRRLGQFGYALPAIEQLPW